MPIGKLYLVESNKLIQRKIGYLSVPWNWRVHQKRGKNQEKNNGKRGEDSTEKKQSKAKLLLL